MTCACGNYTRFAHFGGKTSDMASMSVRHLNISYDGYVPAIEGIGGGDYYDFKVCLECGRLQGFKTPLSDTEVRESIGQENEENEWLIDKILEAKKENWSIEEIVLLLEEDGSRTDLIETFQDVDAGHWTQQEVIDIINGNW